MLPCDPLAKLLYPTHIPSELLRASISSLVCHWHRSVGDIEAKVFAVGLLGWGNYTFYRDIAIPPKVDCTIEFSM